MCIYLMQWQRNKGNPGTELFDDLPVAFQAELSLETYKNIIKKVDKVESLLIAVIGFFVPLLSPPLSPQSTLFQDAPEEFMRMLSLVAEQQLYLPSQVIISKGDIGQYMYIITRGQAEVYIYTLYMYCTCVRDENRQQAIHILICTSKADSI